MTRLRRTLTVSAWLCATGVLAYWASLRFIGEAWWPTTVALYLPHGVLLAPVAAVALALLLIGPRRLALVPSAAACVLLGPVMGLSLSGPATATPGRPLLRILSFNTDSGKGSIDGMVQEIVDARPDLVLLQESAPSVNDAVAAAFPAFHTLTSTQFFVASRHPIVDLLEPGKIELGGVGRSPRFIRVTLDTPHGSLDVFNVHPISPRDALDNVHGSGVLVELRTGAALSRDRRVVTRNTRLRQAQVELIASLASSSPNPVLIAGDTNLAGPSRLLAETLGHWQDGFASAGRGFGYTFPVGRHGAWMRLDRILAGRDFRFLQFGVGRGKGSDHHCVWAEVEQVAIAPIGRVAP